MGQRLRAALLGAAFFILSAASVASPTRHPLIIGDVLPDVQLDKVDGQPIDLSQALGQGPNVVILARPESFEAERESGALKTLVPYFNDLGYQVVLIASEAASGLRELSESYKYRKLFVDHDHRANAAFGLISETPANAVFIVDANRRITNAFVSLSDRFPISGESLVLAARVARDVAHGTRESVGLLFKSPDSSILDLLVHEDISNHDRWFYSLEAGGSLLEARQEIFLPRWQPGLQVGRRFGRTGAFFTFQFNQSFDFTQEVKKLEVYHLGFGLDHVFLYGRVRTSAAAGLAILGTQTDFDNKGTRGWFLDVRPLSVRFSGLRNQTLELTPLSMNLSIPVARGIPLILFSYFTTLSMEFGG